MHFVVIAGTETAVGKTWVTANLARVLQTDGIKIALRKPSQSFDPPGGIPDSIVLSMATGEEPETICPQNWSFPIPMAPPMAAAQLGRVAPCLKELTDALNATPKDADICLVEALGGIKSPLATDGDTADLIAALRPNLVILVANPGLGMINLVRMSLTAIQTAKTWVYCNRFQHDNVLHAANAKWLTHEGATIFTELDTLASSLCAELCIQKRDRAT